MNGAGFFNRRGDSPGGDFAGRVRDNSQPSLRVDRVSRWEELERLRPAWDELLDSSDCSVCIFSTPEFCQSWWTAYGEGRELFFLVCTEEDGIAVGIAPLYREKHRGGWRLRLIGDGSDHDVDGFDFIVRGGSESDVACAFLEWLSCHPKEWSLLELNSVPSESLALASIRRANGSSRLVNRESLASHRLCLLP